MLATKPNRLTLTNEQAGQRGEVWKIFVVRNAFKRKANKSLKMAKFIRKSLCVFG